MSVIETDPDAQAFFDATGITDGATKTAINVYVLDAKNNANPWWIDELADYPMVGGTAASCAVNLKNPGTFDITWVNTVAGDFTANGWTPNGTTSYGRTGLIPSIDLTIQSAALEYYSRDNTLESAADIGATNGAAQSLFTFLYHAGLTFTLFDCYNGTNTTGRNEADPTRVDGGMTQTRISNVDSRLFRKGVQYGSTLAATGGTQPTVEIYLGSRNSSGSPNTFSTKECAGASICDGLTTAQVLAQYTARQTMNTSLSRQV